MNWRFVSFAALFVTCLLTANTMAAKLVTVGGVVLSAAIVIFPVSYIVGDVLTEVWGYGAARRVIWLGFGCNAIMVAAIWLGGEIPAAPFWRGGAAFSEILGQTPRILAASFVRPRVRIFIFARTKELANSPARYATKEAARIRGVCPRISLYAAPPLQNGAAGISPPSQIAATMSALHPKPSQIMRRAAP